MLQLILARALQRWCALVPRVEETFDESNAHVFQEPVNVVLHEFNCPKCFSSRHIIKSTSIRRHYSDIPDGLGRCVSEVVDISVTIHVRRSIIAEQNTKQLE